MSSDKKHSLPGVIFIGPMKTGTSWIHDYLSTRPEVLLPNGVKETFYFDRRDSEDIAWYQSHFPLVNNVTPEHVIEVAPSYFHSTHAPDRIRHALHNPIIIATYRDPVKRAWAHYLHLRRKGYTDLPLAKAIEAFPEIIEASSFKKSLSCWSQRFPEQDIHIFDLALLSKSPHQFAEKLCEVLGLDFNGVPENMLQKVNAGVFHENHSRAKTGRTIANILRKYRIYGPINFAKSIGLKGFFFGKASASTVIPQLSEDDAAWLSELLVGESLDLPLGVSTCSELGIGYRIAETTS